MTHIRGLCQRNIRLNTVHGVHVTKTVDGTDSDSREGSICREDSVQGLSTVTPLLTAHVRESVKIFFAVTTKKFVWIEKE